MNWGLGFPGIISLSFSILAVFVSEVLQFVNTSIDWVEKKKKSEFYLVTYFQSLEREQLLIKG